MKKILRNQLLLLLFFIALSTTIYFAFVILAAGNWESKSNGCDGGLCIFTFAANFVMGIFYLVILTGLLLTPWVLTLVGYIKLLETKPSALFFFIVSFTLSVCFAAMAWSTLNKSWFYFVAISIANISGLVYHYFKIQRPSPSGNESE